MYSYLCVNKLFYKKFQILNNFTINIDTLLKFRYRKLYNLAANRLFTTGRCLMFVVILYQQILNRIEVRKNKQNTKVSLGRYIRNSIKFIYLLVIILQLINY